MLCTFHCTLTTLAMYGKIPFSTVKCLQFIFMSLFIPRSKNIPLHSSVPISVHYIKGEMYSTNI